MNSTDEHAAQTRGAGRDARQAGLVRQREDGRCEGDGAVGAAGEADPFGVCDLFRREGIEILPEPDDG